MLIAAEAKDNHTHFKDEFEYENIQEDYYNASQEGEEDEHDMDVDNEEDFSNQQEMQFLDHLDENQAYIDDENEPEEEDDDINRAEYGDEDLAIEEETQEQEESQLQMNQDTLGSMKKLPSSSGVTSTTKHTSTKHKKKSHTKKRKGHHKAKDHKVGYCEGAEEHKLGDSQTTFTTDRQDQYSATQNL